MLNAGWAARLHEQHNNIFNLLCYGNSLVLEGGKMKGAFKNSKEDVKGEWVLYVQSARDRNTSRETVRKSEFYHFSGLYFPEANNRKNEACTNLRVFILQQCWCKDAEKIFYKRFSLTSLSKHKYLNK